MNVRPAENRDLPAVKEILDRCGLTAEGLDYSDWTGVLLVAVRQSQVIGFISALPGKPYAVVTELGVLPEFQKGPACRKLIEGLELLLRSLGCRAWAGYVGDKRGLTDSLGKWGAESMGTGQMWLRRFR